MRKILLAALAILAALSFTGAHAETVEVAGIKFDTVETVANTKLQLNGAGIRYKAIFKVYAAGLYLQNKANTPEAILADKGPKRLHIVALRDIDGNDLGKLFTKGVEANATREEFVKAINGMLRSRSSSPTRRSSRRTRASAWTSSRALARWSRSTAWCRAIRSRSPSSTAPSCTSGWARTRRTRSSRKLLGGGQKSN